jgi:uncharacterized protein YjbI with pentapeptide repeats
MSDDVDTKARLRFRLRTALVCMALVALLIGWYTSMERERAKSARFVQQLMNAQFQVRMAESRAEMQDHAVSRTKTRGKGALAKASFEGVDLRDVVIKAGTSAFQLTIFDNSDLSGTSLTGGDASFQGSSFKNAILKNAKLGGGGSSFQLATFENADLSGASLTGNLQGMSLRKAKCIGARINGSFQSVNIDAAQFQQADLSAISHQDLASGYYETPPTYNAKTSFPDGFDPNAHGWKKEATNSGND